MLAEFLLAVGQAAPCHPHDPSCQYSDDPRLIILLSIAIELVTVAATWWFVRRAATRKVRQLALAIGIGFGVFYAVIMTLSTNFASPE